MISLKKCRICIIFIFYFMPGMNLVYFKKLSSSRCNNNNNTCHGRETSLLYNTTEDQWLKTGCLCDEKCIFYEDCCADKVLAKKNRSTVKTYRCAKIKGEPIFIYEKHFCPTDFPDENIRNLCETSNNTFSKIRATNIETKTTYSNYYCAICNGENEAEIILWNLIVECPSESLNFSIESYTNNSFDLRTELNSLAESCTLNSIDIQLIPPLEIKNNMRRCKPCVSSCDKDWTDDDIIRKCKVEPLNYIYDNSQCYRNEYCAICNSVNKSTLTCDDLYLKTNWNYEFSYDVYQWQFGLNRNCTERNNLNPINGEVHIVSFTNGELSCKELGKCLDDNGFCLPCTRKKRNSFCSTKFVIQLAPPISKWQLYFDKINIKSILLSEKEVLITKEEFRFA